MRILSDNQRQAIEKLKRLKVGALFMGCGTGKTQTAVMLINSVECINSVMWVCPLRTVENVRTELKKCGLKFPVDFVGVESIGMSDRIYLETLNKVNKQVFLVVDESVKIKNIEAKRTKRLLNISTKVEYKLILNGTPITKDILDIYTQMEFLSPKILNMSFSRFKSNYCVIKEKWEGNKKIKEWISEFTNIKHLLTLIDPFIYECSLNLSLQKTYRVINYSLSYDERNEYELLKEYMFNLYSNALEEKNVILGIFNKLQRFYSLARNKFEVLNGLVDDKTIIFCKFVNTEAELIKRYQQALVLTYGKSSFGLNLQKYNRTIYFDKTFDYAFREQSEARTYRTGQQNNCEYIDLTGDVGLEEMMDMCIDKKLSLIDAFKKYGNDLRKL